ncbi:nitronate monooxygenase family protein [Paraburkholderia fungorum]|uniref:Nitronate monooxygenase n=1 Tax=Paraburkholderia fungorum TaxID=134537 RepID=A0AAP5QGJ4_9BURK|nr:nitronate monooxygenase [Paraburkholderia fungorum]AJZ57043.1 nitronate monooxygenase family protein [Paraburkholderia fungorum]MDT8843295.1 nitronate monooxygenase [Paraburkholderia fungorum]
MAIDTTSFATPLTRMLGCWYPVISAGMGGPARAELAAAVSHAGGFGLLGMVRESPELISREIAAVRAFTDQPFGVNLIPSATEPALLAAELDACLDARVPAICFFWDVVPDVVARAKDAGVLVLYQVGSLEDALAAEQAGADIVIAQGIEAGGHVRGRTGILTLLPEIARLVRIPVVASGGFATGAGLVAALALGAAGIHCGTLFLATHESFAHDYHKQRILAARAGDTVYTDLFAINWPPHSPVRVLANSLTGRAGSHLFGHHPDSLPRDVIAYDEGRPIYRFSTDSPLRTTVGDLEQMALFAGESAVLVDQVSSAAEVIERLLNEAIDASSQIAPLCEHGSSQSKTIPG